MNSGGGMESSTTPGTSAMGGTAGATGSGGATTAACAMSNWPNAALEDEMLVQINLWREMGATCDGDFNEYILPLSDSETLRCAARVHSVTLFTMNILTTAATQVQLWSNPPATLDVPSFLETTLYSGGVDCENILNSGFSVVGIGFATDERWGYWTLYLADS